VVKDWPEFGAAGKGEIPVRWLLPHQAGLPVIDTPLTFEDACAWHPGTRGTEAAVAADTPPTAKEQDMQPERSVQRAHSTSESTPPLGRYHEVGGRWLLLHRSGNGSPPVVFLPGGGAVGLDYLNVQQQAAKLTTSVLYDRAGTGWSDRVELPRTSAQVTDELRELLLAADVPAPYLLVGHSLGGLYARHYAQRFPDQVAALLLLGPAHEDYSAYMPQPLVDQWDAWDPDQALPNE
jgi:pimeloyl-ACP methyl ester carboxylesterase